MISPVQTTCVFQKTSGFLLEGTPWKSYLAWRVCALFRNLTVWLRGHRHALLGKNGYSLQHNKLIPFLNGWFKITNNWPAFNRLVNRLCVFAACQRVCVRACVCVCLCVCVCVCVFINAAWLHSLWSTGITFIVVVFDIYPFSLTHLASRLVSKVGFHIRLQKTLWNKLFSFFVLEVTVHI